MNNTLPTPSTPEQNNSSRLIKNLCEKGKYQHKITAVHLVETHISWVLLTGQFAYKIKKPVNFGFLDFSSLEKRHYFCQEELRLNRRFAEDLYLDVVPITGTPDCPEMGGDGQAIEYAVKMRQFPSGFILTELAKAGKLSEDNIDQIPAMLAEFHAKIARAGEDSPYGDSENIKKWFDENFDHISPRLADDQQLAQIRAIQNWGLKTWRNLTGLMRQRKLHGYVRECHGDLHLGNMTLFRGKITLFDCIEFNPMLRWIDVISEVAFLLVDLSHAGCDTLGYRFLNRYLNATGDYSGLRLLRYYLVYRALVRAKVALLRLDQQQTQAGIPKSAHEYSEYVNLAEHFTNLPPPLLILTHGYSGSGKSTIASQLAEKMGAIQLRSDIERKRLYGYAAMEPSGSGLDNGLYSAEAGQKTYRKLAELAKDVIAGGFPTLVDAAFLKSEQRRLFREVATECAARFVIIDFQASPEALRQRILFRQQQKMDPSEATIDVLKQQLETAEALSDEEADIVISINTESDDALETLLAILADISWS
ncbi:MAG: bifunctional aminoglycoside phosphotransferase/ATP-binding protein [Methylosarcina sp.]